MVPGPYVAMLNHTDDYPHIEIALQIDVRDIGESSGLALLFTESQGECHAPWGSSQARVAKMEGGDPQASIESLVRALAALGAKPRLKVA